MSEVVLVNRQGAVVGQTDKILVHRRGLLHLAFSIFVVNSENKILIQQRSLGKYHTPGLWSNSCCSHPKPGESLDHAAHRRLLEELGFDCPLQESFNVYYQVDLGDGLIEHELDYIYVGFFDGQPAPVADEVADLRWETIANLCRELDESPDLFTPWFRIIMVEHSGKIAEALGCLNK